MYGSVPGQSLGRYVSGNIQSSSFPYKAAVSRVGNTGVYTLQTQSDTNVRLQFFGENLLTGDLNGDGWKDIVARRIGVSPSYIDTVIIYWGTYTSIDTLSPTKLTGSNVREAFGSAICIANTIGDSVADLVVTAPQYVFGTFQGRVYVYRGGTPFSTVPFMVLNGESAYYNLGLACTIGDVNCDGFNDLMVRGGHSAPPRFLFLDIWFGGAAFDTTRDIRLTGPDISAAGLACFDANGDGVDDLLWTSADSTRWVYIHYGSTGFNTAPSIRLRNPGVANFGNAIVNTGDMNGDGYVDIGVAAYSANITDGYVFVFGGGPRIDERFDAVAGLDLNSNFGWSVSGIGDVNGDGLGDIIIGAPAYAFGQNKGYWGIFKGDSVIRVTDVRQSSQLPSTIVLHQAYPNPFNPRTTIEYDLKQRAYVTLKVYNVLGQEIRTLINREQEAGEYSIQFDGRGLPSGMYLYEIVVKSTDSKVTRQAKKMLLLSEREKQKQDEYEQQLLTEYRSGDDAALKELAHLQYQRAGGRLKRFLLSPAQPPDTIIYLKDVTVHFYDKDITRLKEMLR